MSLTILHPTPDMMLALLESIQLDRTPCLADSMYQTEEERAGYCKHMAFMAAGAEYRQRLFMAGNRCGKTEGAGGYELALHLTGRYPDWWQGRRFDRPVVAWAAGDTRETTRDILQRKVIGAKGKLLDGLALVRPALLGETSPGLGMPDSFSKVKVKHVSGSFSELIFKSYDQGREAFQGTEVDVILLDEEPPLNVYIECLTRTMTNNGLVMLTFTPLKGMSETVLSFFPDNDVQEGVVNGRHVTMAGWDDAPHLTESSKEEMLATYPPFMRLARSRGLPQMGAGVIYPVDPERYIYEEFDMPQYWPRAYGLDVGWNCTAAAFGAWDDSNQTWYIYAEHYAKQATPLENTHALKQFGEWIPGVVDPASAGSNQRDGVSLFAEYKGLGLDLTSADNSVEAGIMRVWTGLSTGKIKISRRCANLLRELRGYIRDEKGRVVKVNDHCFTYETMIQTAHGPMMIGELCGCDVDVISRNGSVARAVNVRLTRCDTHVIKVLFSDGTSVRCTPDHKFYVDFAGYGGWMEARHLDGKTLRVERELSWSKLFRKFSRSLTGLFTGSVVNTTSDTGKDCTEPCGCQSMEKSQKDSMSTTSTVTKATTALRTLNSYHKKNTFLYTCGGAKTRTSQNRVGMQQRLGMVQKRAKLGTWNTTKNTSIYCTKNTLASVNSVARPILVEKLAQGSVQTTVKQSFAKRLALTTCNVFALCVVSPLKLISTLRQRHVKKSVQLRCVGVIDSGETSDVYCMDVPGVSAFTLENGVLVHNCADALRYLIMSGGDVKRAEHYAKPYRSGGGSRPVFVV